MEPGISVGVVLNYIAVHPVSPPPPSPYIREVWVQLKRQNI